VRTDFATAIQWTKTEEKFFCFSMLNINFFVSSFAVVNDFDSVQFHETTSKNVCIYIYISEYIYISDRVEWKRKTRRVEAVTSVAGDDDGDFYTNKDDVDTLKTTECRINFYVNVAVCILMRHLDTDCTREAQTVN